MPRPAALDRDLVMCPWFRVGDQVVRTIGMAARFEQVADVTLDELRIELLYPLRRRRRELLQQTRRP